MALIASVPVYAKTKDSRTTLSSHPPKVSATQLARIGMSKAWRRLLFYTPTWRGDERSLVDSPGFFFATTGKDDPIAEANATWQAMQAPWVEAEADTHARCRFPARWHFLAARLQPEALQDNDRKHCPRFDTWRRLLDYDAVSLVFSSYYPNNPSSLFGHTFLRLHRRTQDASLATGMLDDALNFSAYADDANPFLYALKGVTGGFPGRFALTPYYVKIQEYANAESRDLWEYRLNFDEAEIETLLRLFWEMDGQSIDYYYFDENCSAILMSLLEAMRPRLDLVTWSAWVIPVDTLRSVAQSPALVQNVSFRASSFRRFSERYAVLTPDEREQLHLIVRQQEPPGGSSSASPLILTAGLAPAARARVLDALLEYIDFDEKLAGDQRAEVHADLRRRALLERAQVKVKPETLASVPYAERPDQGHSSARWGLGVAAETKAPVSWLWQWRPALHDMLARSDGFASDLSISFFDTQLRIRTAPAAKRGVDLERFSLLAITSLPTAERLVRRPAWFLDVGTQLARACPETQTTRCRRSAIQGGAGATAVWADGALVTYAMTGLGLGFETTIDSMPYASPQLKVGLRAQAGAWHGWLEALPQWIIHAGRRPRFAPGGQLALSYTPPSRWEWRLEGLAEGNWREGRFGFLYYY